MSIDARTWRILCCLVGLPELGLHGYRVFCEKADTEWECTRSLAMS